MNDALDEKQMREEKQMNDALDEKQMREEKQMSDAFEVPTVDITAFVADRTDSAGGAAESARAEVVDRVRAACETVGFIQVVGHAIPDATIAGLTAAMDWFFGLSPEEKCRHVPDRSDTVGYSPPKQWSLIRSMGVQPANQMNDFFEGFNLARPAEDYPGLGLSAEDYQHTRWPAEASFRTQVRAYFDEASRVARTMMTIFVAALGDAGDGLGSLFDHPLENMRLNNYALPEGEIDVDGDLTGMGEHTDFGLVTVLWADQVPGLQVLGGDGRWYDVQPRDGALLINLGDLLARLTNDRWSSTLHRVKPPIVDGRVRRRRSAALFFEANADATIGTLEQFVDPVTAPARYGAPIAVGEHIRAKFRGSAYGTAVPTAGTEVARVAAATSAPGSSA